MAFEWVDHRENDSKIKVSETNLTEKQISELQESYTKEANIIKDKSIADRWQLRRVSFETNNDNGLSLRKWTDDGLTFGIHAGTTFEKWENKRLEISAWMDSYTENPEYRDQNDEWVARRDWGDTSARVDRWYIEWVYSEEKNLSDNTSISYSAGAWLGYTWNLWGQKIQNAWHENTLGKKTMDDPYTVHADYDSFKNPFLYWKAWVEWQHNITDNLYVTAQAQLQLSLYNEAPNIMSWEAWAWFDTKYIRWEVWIEWYSHLSDQSSIIQDFYDKWKDIWTYWEVAIWARNSWPEIFWRASTKHGWQWKVWVRWNFS